MRALFLGLFAVGCSYTSPYMRAAPTPAALQPPAGTALVVFIRPSQYAMLNGVTIIDEAGHFVGDATAASQFAVAVAPGRHLFVAWAENTDAVQLEAAPGKVYFVEIGMAPGFFSPSTYMHGITSRLSSWPRRDEWLRSTTFMVPDSAAGNSYLAARAADVAERLRRGQDCLSKYRGEDLDKHSVRAEDGL